MKIINLLSTFLAVLKTITTYTILKFILNTCIDILSKIIVIGNFRWTSSGLQFIFSIFAVLNIPKFAYASPISGQREFFFYHHHPQPVTTSSFH